MKIYSNQLIFCIFSAMFDYSLSDFRDDLWFPRYHLASLDGFMNDPNGMIYLEGYYHAFYQHTPDNVSSSGLKHWGHATSKDMLVWQHTREALTPSIPEDSEGCFSGSAIADEYSNLYLIYTGVSTVNNRTHQVQCLAVSRDEGYDTEKKGKIIESSTYFENFRDPKVWKQGDLYYVVIGAMNQSNISMGQVVLYKSQDLSNWQSEGILAGPLNNTGFMWECPDMYTLNDKQVLSFSYQELKQDGSVGYKSGYLIGSWKPGETFRIEQNFTEFDKGHDFYASQSFLAKDGRRIMVAWMNMWDTPFPEAKMGWVGAFTLPRELTLDEDGRRVLANPIKEVEAYRSDLISHFTMLLYEDQQFLEVYASTYYLSNEIEFEWDLEVSSASRFGIQLTGSTTDDEGFFLFVNKTESKLVLRRNYPQFGFPESDRSIKIDMNSTLYTRIFFDFSTVEVFVNRGETVLSSRIYPNGIQRNIYLFTHEGDALFRNFTNWGIAVQ